MHSSRIAFLPIAPVLLLQALSLAQETATTTSSSALTIVTSDPMVARGVNSMFGGTAALPKLGEGGAFVLSLDDGGKILAREGSGSGWLTVDARPAQLMKIFAQKVTQGRMMASMVGGMAMGQMGVDSSEVDDIVDALFQFPNQIDSLHIAMPSKPEEGKAIDVDIDLGPKAETWFGSFVEALQQHPQGLRRLPAAGAMLSMDADIDMQAVLPLLMPLINKASTMMIADEDLKKQAGPILAKFYEAFAGPMSMTMDPSNGMRMVAELTDGDAVGAIMLDPTYMKVSQEMGEASGLAEITIEPGSFEHRGVKLIKTTVKMDESAEPNPFVKNGKSVSLGGVVRNTMIATGMGSNDDAATAMIDSILDDKLKRQPLPKGNLMSIGIDVAKLVESMADAMGGGPEGEVPARADLNLSKNDKGLHIEVRIK